MPTNSKLMVEIARKFVKTRRVRAGESVARPQPQYVLQWDQRRAKSFSRATASDGRVALPAPVDCHQPTVVSLSWVLV